MSSHPASLDDDRLLRECDVQRTRGSGPGGQHRNKVETAVVLTHRPTGARATASERRSQAENLHQALFRLRVQLALQIRQEVPFPGGPSELWKSRCRGGKLSVNPEHHDFPTLLAEALDHLAAHGMELPAAGAELGCSSSQLVKFLSQEPRALAQVNAHRAAQGRPPLR